MAEQWWAVYGSDGGLVSTGTVVADPLPKGLTAKKLTDRPDMSQVAWNPKTLAFDAQASVASVAEQIAAQPEVQALPKGQQQAILKAAQRVLGG